MKTRSVSFFAEPHQVPEVRRRIEEEVLPRFRELPGFLGFVALQSEGARSEFVALSFWADVSKPRRPSPRSFATRSSASPERRPARQEFTIVKLSVPGHTGNVGIDLP